MINKVNRLWSNRQESKTFHVIGSKVPRTAYGELDGIQHHGDIEFFLGKIYNEHEVLCSMLNRMQRTFQ